MQLLRGPSLAQPETARPPDMAVEISLSCVDDSEPEPQAEESSWCRFIY
ncbi:hypothetical protein DHEL01_v210399, partial [Diaporthe helianthi]